MYSTVNRHTGEKCGNPIVATLNFNIKAHRASFSSAVENWVVFQSLFTLWEEG